jgi:hypothetical protein
VRTGSGTFTPFPLLPPVLRVAGRAVAVAPDRPEPDVALLREALRARDGRARDVVEPEVRARAVVLRPDADVLEAFGVELFEPELLVPPALPPVVRVRDVVALLALVRLALEVLARDVPPPEVLVPEVPALRVPALLVRAAVFRAADVALVATLPASAIPAHPPVDVPERVVRLSPRCFRYQGSPSLARRIQTDLFPEYLTDGYDHDTPCPQYPASPRVQIRLPGGTNPDGPKNR